MKLTELLAGYKGRSEAFNDLSSDEYRADVYDDLAKLIAAVECLSGALVKYSYEKDHGFEARTALARAEEILK